MKLEKNEIAEPVILRFRNIWKKEAKRIGDTRFGERNDAVRDNVFSSFCEKISAKTIGECCQNAAEIYLPLSGSSESSSYRIPAEPIQIRG